MTSSVLTDLLARHLVEIESDDQLQKLQATSKALAGRIKSKKLAATSCTLVAMDIGAEASEPVLVAAMNELSSNWKTVRAKYPDPPITLLRALITDALAQSSTDADIAAIVWLTGISYLPLLEVGEASQLWSTILEDAGERAESEADAAWKGTQQSDKNDKPSSSSSRGLKIDTDNLALHLGAAAGPVQSVPAGVSPNQQQIGAQYGGTANPAWAQAFGAAAAGAIGEAINGAFKRIADALHSEVGTISHTLSATRTIDLRSKVLWWKEALYSPSLKVGYRELDPATAAVVMAHDLACDVPPHSPRSLDFVIGEAVRKLFGSIEPKNISAYCGKLAKNTDALTPLMGKGKIPEGRVTLSEYLKLVLTVDQEADLSQRTGIPENFSLSVPDFAVWVFRNFQAARIASGK